ncbi:MAG: hypothetical protein PHW73_00400 [Atribacterota bacterium]|nr:hypothetical protein [Atribacterota bacterium]
MKKDPRKLTPSQNSEAAIWKEFHKALVDVFGQEKGNEIFMSYWNNRGNKSAINADLLSYLEKEGITIDAPLSARLSLSAKETFNAIKSKISTIFKFSLGSSLAVGMIAIIVIIMVLKAVLKDPEKFAGAAKTYTKPGV